jgi:carbonyl reductase 1
MKALKELTLNGENIQFHQLDIENQESIDKFANFIKEKHQGLDVLVNNAALLFPVKNQFT